MIGLAAGSVAHDAAEPRLGDLFEAHHRRLYGLARRLVSSSDEARDLVQDTFLRAARAPQSVPWGMPSEEAWLVRVLINLCRDRWRQRAAQRRRQAAGADVELAGSGRTCESAVIAKSVVWKALRELPPRRRAVIVLHELDGHSVMDVAALLGIARVTVRWHLSTGRRELSRIIKDKG